MALFSPAPSRRRIAGQLVWFLVWAVGLAIALWLEPSPTGHGTHTQLGLPPCPSLLVSQRPCPGCGLTTSFSATAQLDLAHAWRSHPFGPLLFGLWTLSAWLALYGFVRRRRLLSDHRVVQVSLVALIASYLLFGALRMALGQPLPLAGDQLAKSAGRPPVCQNSTLPPIVPASTACTSPANALPE
jgi:hypothetical protein